MNPEIKRLLTECRNVLRNASPRRQDPVWVEAARELVARLEAALAGGESGTPGV